MVLPLLRASAPKGKRGIDGGDHPAEPAEAVTDLESATSDELRGLLAFTEASSRPLTMTEMARMLLETLVSTYGFARGAVLEGGVQLNVVAQHGCTWDGVGPCRSTGVSNAQASGTAVLIAASDTDPSLRQSIPDGELLVHALSWEDRHFGAVVLQIPSAWTAHQRDLVLSRVARVTTTASQALWREHRWGQLRRLATTDDLTMIANRRAFDAALERELARAVRNGTPVSLALLDLDLFKQVNDLHGHPAGDDLLRNVAAALAGACRELDTPARYGGEEFAVILPDCDVEDAREIVDRIRRALSAAPGVQRITASAGVASYPDDALHREPLVDAADQALLEAKRAGRDRTVLARDLGGSAAVAPPVRDRHGDGAHEPG